MHFNSSIHNFGGLSIPINTAPPLSATKLFASDLSGYRTVTRAYARKVLCRYLPSRVCTSTSVRYIQA